MWNLVLVLGDLFGRSCRKSYVDSSQVVNFTLSLFCLLQKWINLSDYGISFHRPVYLLYWLGLVFSVCELWPAWWKLPPIRFKIYPMPLQQCSYMLTLPRPLSYSKWSGFSSNDAVSRFLVVYWLLSREEGWHPCTSCSYCVAGNCCMHWAKTHAWAVGKFTYKWFWAWLVYFICMLFSVFMMIFFPTDL